MAFHTISKLGIRPDLQKERSSATFNSDDLTNIIHGGPEKAQRRREIITTLFSHPAFNPQDQHFQSISESYENAVKKATTLLKVGVKNGWSRDEMEIAVESIWFDVAMGVHVIMFLPALERLGTEEQKERWLPLAMSLRMIGTYGQTELGHGTNLRELETTATYDPTTEEFVLNTPLPSGMKWWPGGLGMSANHVILLAQLVTNGRNCGMQAFLVPIRDMDTHLPLPGVEVGDIGPKVGLRSADNGFLILHDVRIPRTNMLMRYNQVTPEGEFFTQKQASQATYGTMVMVRSQIVHHSFNFVAHATTVATRYSCVRRQSELEPGAGEVQIIDFQTQQYKLFPNIALGYAIFFARQYILDTYEKMYQTELRHGNFNNLPELHSQTCCLKASTTECASEAVSILRLACGGHGYLLSSGIGMLLMDSLAGMTYEGENTVLYLQTARFLVKEYAKVVSGGQVRSSSAYLGGQLRPASIRTPDDCLKQDLLTSAFHTRALYMVHRSANNFQKAISAGKAQHVAWDENAVSLVMAAKAHSDSFVTVNFFSAVDSLEVKPEVKDVLLTLTKLHALHRIVMNAGEFLESGALNSSQMEMVRQQEMKLLPIIRPNAVALVDAFEFHDMTLNSTLGSYDGQVYERLVESTHRNPMNKSKVHPAYYKYIKPFQKAALEAKL